jgi:hypothetical protein
MELGGVSVKRIFFFWKVALVVSMNKGFLNTSDEVTTLIDQKGFHDLKI